MLRIGKVLMFVMGTAAGLVAWQARALGFEFMRDGFLGWGSLAFLAITLIGGAQVALLGQARGAMVVAAASLAWLVLLEGRVMVFPWLVALLVGLALVSVGVALGMLRQGRLPPD